MRSFKFVTVFILCISVISACSDHSSEANNHNESHHQGHKESDTLLFKDEKVAISNAWARQPPPNATTAAIYLAVKNLAATAIKLVGVASDNARDTQLHTTITLNNVSKMKQVHSFIIDTEDVLRLAPKGNHIMLIGLNVPLTNKDYVSLRLEFEPLHVIEIKVPVVHHKDAEHSHH